jgi:hypothetical protein
MGRVKCFCILISMQLRMFSLDLEGYYVFGIIEGFVNIVLLGR